MSKTFIVVKTNKIFKKMSKEPSNPEKYTPGDGFRSMKSTGLFRAVNFELYAKPVRV